MESGEVEKSDAIEEATDRHGKTRRRLRTTSQHADGVSTFFSPPTERSGLKDAATNECRPGLRSHMHAIAP
jgi:hypothetical protein